MKVAFRGKIHIIEYKPERRGGRQTSGRAKGRRAVRMISKRARRSGWPGGIPHPADALDRYGALALYVLRLRAATADSAGCCCRLHSPEGRTEGRPAAKSGPCRRAGYAKAVRSPCRRAGHAKGAFSEPESGKRLGLPEGKICAGKDAKRKTACGPGSRPETDGRDREI